MGGIVEHDQPLARGIRRAGGVVAGGGATIDIAVGDRIAQMIVMPVTRARFIPVDELPGSVRGEGGFGSTGYSNEDRNGR